MPSRPAIRPSAGASSLQAPLPSQTPPPQAPLSIEAKIVVLGAQGVGKTSLVHRLVTGSPPPNDSSVPSTIGASFLTKKIVDVDTGTSVRLQVWDTAGQERFRSLGKLYYRGANAALLCYDITRADSLRDVDGWLREIRANLPDDTVIHVVGTKADVVAEDPGKRAVGFESVVAYAAENLCKPGHIGGAGIASAGGSSTVGTPLNGSALTPAPAVEKGDTPQVSTASNRLSWLGGVTVGASSSSNALVDQTPTPAVQQTPFSDATNSLFPPTQAYTPRTSSFWGTDLGWDSCHEVSASSGEGVEELFRVVTQRLVEQRNSRVAFANPSSNAAADDRYGAGLEDATVAGKKASSKRGARDGNDPYYYGGTEWGDGSGGSFRVGAGDRRRSWLGLPVIEGETGDTTRARRGGCCGG
jgi:small GTP-binding protein